MSDVGKPERATQNRVIHLFSDELGYHYLGDRSDFANSNIEDAHLRAFLKSSGYLLWALAHESHAAFAAVE